MSPFGISHVSMRECYQPFLAFNTFIHSAWIQTLPSPKIKPQVERQAAPPPLMLGHTRVMSFAMGSNQGSNIKISCSPTPPKAWWQRRRVAGTWNCWQGCRHFWHPKVFCQLLQSHCQHPADCWTQSTLLRYWRNSSDPAYPIIWSGRRVSTDHLEASVALEVADQGLLCLSRHYVHTWIQLRYL